jgi:hypothetical protein
MHSSSHFFTHFCVELKFGIVCQKGTVSTKTEHGIFPSLMHTSQPPEQDYSNEFPTPCHDLHSLVRFAFKLAWVSSRSKHPRNPTFTDISRLGNGTRPYPVLISTMRAIQDWETWGTWVMMPQLQRFLLYSIGQSVPFRLHFYTTSAHEITPCRLVVRARPCFQITKATHFLACVKCDNHLSG